MNPIWAVCQECLIRCSFNCEANPAELEAKRCETARLCSWDSSAYVQHIQTIPPISWKKDSSARLAKSMDTLTSWWHKVLIHNAAWRFKVGGVLEIVTLSRVSLHQLITTYTDIWTSNVYPTFVSFLILFLSATCTVVSGLQPVGLPLNRFGTFSQNW